MSHRYGVGSDTHSDSDVLKIVGHRGVYIYHFHLYFIVFLTISPYLQDVQGKWKEKSCEKQKSRENNLWPL